MALQEIIAGGAIALAGTAVGPLVTHWLNDTKSKEAVRIAHIQELIIMAYEYRDQMASFARLRATVDNPQIEQPSFSKGKAIIAIYFPELIPAVAQMEVDGSSVAIWALDKAQERWATGEMPSMKDFGDLYPKLAASAEVVAYGLARAAQPMPKQSIWKRLRPASRVPTSQMRPEGEPPGQKPGQ